MYQIATGVSRTSVAQIEALNDWAQQLQDPPHGRQMRINLDLVNVDGAQVLRVRYGDQAVTIGIGGRVQAVKAEAADPPPEFIDEAGIEKVFLALSGMVPRSADWAVLHEVARGNDDLGEATFSCTGVADYLWDHIMGEPDVPTQEQVLAAVRLAAYAGSTPDEVYIRGMTAG